MATADDTATPTAVGKMVAGVVVSNVNREVRSPAETVGRVDGPNPMMCVIKRRRRKRTDVAA
jgi:hypothetical protein